MTTQQELLAALRGRFGDSQTAIAAALDISLSRLNNYVRDQRKMDDEAVIACCELLGWNAQKYVAKHRAEISRTKREQAFWKRVSAAAALLLFAVVPFFNPAAAYTVQQQTAHAERPSAVCIMRTVAALIRAALRFLRGRSPASVLA